MEEREISISPMFKWFTNRFGKKDEKVEKVEKVEKARKGKKGKKDEKDRKDKKDKKARLLWGKQFNVAKEGLDEEQVVDFVNDLIAQHGA